MNYIITSSDRKYLEFLYEFIYSLNSIGNFDGVIKVLYYYEEGDDFKGLEIFNFNNVEFICIEKTDIIINNVFYFDVEKILKTLNDVDRIAIYDCDIWFNDDISDLFKLNPKGIICSTEIVKDLITEKEQKHWIGYVNNVDMRFNKNVEKYKHKLLSILNDLKSSVNAGFIYSNVKVMKEKINKINKIQSDGYYKSCMTDQIALNISIDLEKDECLMNTYNYCLTRDNVDNINLDTLLLNGERIKVLHYNEKLNPIKVNSFHEFRFMNYYEDILKRSK